MTSYICSFLNKRYSTNLYHILHEFHSDKHEITNNYCSYLNTLDLSLKYFNFTKEDFHKFRNQSLNIKKDEDAKFLMQSIEKELGKCLVKLDQGSLNYMEKLLIGLLGHRSSIIRDTAISQLNQLYD